VVGGRPPGTTLPQHEPRGQRRGAPPGGPPRDRPAAAPQTQQGSTAALCPRTGSPRAGRARGAPADRPCPELDRRWRTDP